MFVVGVRVADEEVGGPGGVRNTLTNGERAQWRRMVIGTLGTIETVINANVAAGIVLCLFIEHIRKNALIDLKKLC